MYKDLELLEFWFCSGGIADKYGMFLQNTKMNVLILIFQRSLTTSPPTKQMREKASARKGEKALGLEPGWTTGTTWGLFSLFWALSQGKALTFSWFSTTLTIAKTSYTQRQRQANGKLTIKWYHLLFWCPRRQINWQWQWAWTYEFSSNRPPNLPICYLKQL